MDILRRELNAIYVSQHLDTERLDNDIVAALRSLCLSMTGIDGECRVITDCSSDRSYLSPGLFGDMMPFVDGTGDLVVESSDEDEIYNLMHPEDLVDKRMLEYEFFRFVDSLDPMEKMKYHASCRIRVADKNGNYRCVDNSTRLARLSPAGKIWLILCRYSLSSLEMPSGGIAPAIVNASTGKVRRLSFGKSRCDILTSREKDILRLISMGKLSKEIAAMLYISVHTVNRHRQNILEKLSVDNSIEAVRAATAMRLL